MLLFLLLACTELLRSAPKFITFTPYVPFECKKLLFESKQIPYPEYLYLLMSLIFVNLIAPNKEFFGVKVL